MSYLQIIQDEDITKFIPLYTTSGIAYKYSPTINKAYGEAIMSGIPSDKIKSFVIEALENTLSEYSKTPYTTKSGKILRKLAVFFTLFNPLRWLNIK